MRHQSNFPLWVLSQVLSLPLWDLSHHFPLWSSSSIRKIACQGHQPPIGPIGTDGNWFPLHPYTSPSLRLTCPSETCGAHGGGLLLPTSLFIHNLTFYHYQIIYLGIVIKQISCSSDSQMDSLHYQTDVLQTNAALQMNAVLHNYVEHHGVGRKMSERQNSQKSLDWFDAPSSNLDGNSFCKIWIYTKFLKWY